VMTFFVFSVFPAPDSPVISIAWFFRLVSIPLCSKGKSYYQFEKKIFAK
jgi:hypothetical protein